MNRMKYPSLAGICALTVFAATAQEPVPEVVDADPATGVESAPPVSDPTGSDPASNPTSLSSGQVGVTDSVASVPPPDGTRPAAPKEDEAGVPGNRFIEEITVTAQKREENLQDVPISVTALSAATLDARGIVEQYDLPKIVPSLTVTSSVGFTYYFLRGIGSDAVLMADPSVTLYVDGVYLPFAHGGSQNFGAVQRVEVLKGPQGTLFGRNAIGGAISVVTKSPGPEPVIEVEGGYESYNDVRSRVHVNVPITDTFATSFSGYYTDRESYYDDRSTVAGQPLPNEISKGARVKAKWYPTDYFDQEVGATVLRQQGVSSNFAPAEYATVLSGPGAGQPNASDFGETHLSEPAYINVRQKVLYSTTNLRFDWFDTKLILSDQDFVDDYMVDFDATDRPLANFEVTNEYALTKTGEFQLLSNDTSWGSDWLSYIVGVYYFKGRQAFDPVFFGVGGLDLENGSGGGTGVPDYLVDLTNNILAALPPGPLPNSFPTGGIRIGAIIDSKSLAEFAQVTAKLTDWMSLTVGLRHQKEKREVVESSSALGGSAQDEQVVPIRSSQEGAFKDSKTTLKPKVTLELRPFADEEVMFYATYQEAVKGATYNTINIYDDVDFIPQEEISAYEIGVKSKLFDNTVTLNASVWDYDIENLQVQFVSLLAGGAVNFQTAERASSRGVDVDLSMLVLPDLVDNLVILGSGAYVKARYDKFEHANSFDDDTGLFVADTDLSGNDMIRTPKWSGTVSLSKGFTAPGGSLEVSGDVTYQSGFFFWPSNHERAAQPDTTLYGARISYLYEARNLRFSLFGKNLTDVRYYLGRFENDFGVGDALSPPRTFGAQVSWSF